MSEAVRMKCLLKPQPAPKTFYEICVPLSPLIHLCITQPKWKTCFFVSFYCSTGCQSCRVQYVTGEILKGLHKQHRWECRKVNKWTQSTSRSSRWYFWVTLRTGRGCFLCVCAAEAGNIKLLQGLMACELLGQEGQMETLQQCAPCVPRRVQQLSTDQINLQKLGCLCHLNRFV